jgi:transcriptional regulator with XRE-family HTH domain
VKGGSGRLPPSRAYKVLHAKGLHIRELARLSGLTEGALSRLLRGERGGTSETLLRLIDAAPTVDAVELLRALVLTRAEWLQRKKVQHLIATR